VDDLPVGVGACGETARGDGATDVPALVRLLPDLVERGAGVPGTGEGFGELSVNKAVADPSPGLNTIPATFHVDVVCTDNASTTAEGHFDLVPGAAPAGGPAQTVTDIPEGSTCVVTESPVPSPAVVSYSSNNIVVQEGDQVSVTVTNTYPEVGPSTGDNTPPPNSAAEAVQVTPTFTG